MRGIYYTIVRGGERDEEGVYTVGTFDKGPSGKRTA